MHPTVSIVSCIYSALALVSMMVRRFKGLMFSASDARHQNSKKDHVERYAGDQLV